MNYDSYPDDEHVYELFQTSLSDSKGIVLMLRIYMDESGTHEGSDVTTVAAYFGRPSEWQKWTRKWNKQKKPIKVFHAVDCANLVGEFKDWSVEARDCYVKDLLEIIAKSNIGGHVTGINNNDLSKCLLEFPLTKSILGSSYEICFQLVVQKILEDLDRLEIGSRVAIVHEVNDHKEEVLNCFNWIKNNSQHKERKLSLTFAGKDDAVPLQAADILAYEGNKRSRNPNGKERRAWRALNPEKKSIEFSLFNYEAIADWLLSLEKRGLKLR